jgi:hypothetical protein
MTTPWPQGRGRPWSLGRYRGLSLFGSFARAGDLGPDETPLAGTWQVAFLGEIRAARCPTRKISPTRVMQLGRRVPPAVNKTHQRIPLSQRGAII